jgi:hypothetical protein
MKGYIIAIIELALYFMGSVTIRNNFKNLNNVNKITYYWVTLTILTGVWEIFYISNYNEISIMANDLIINNEHVWTNNYNISYILPWKFSKIFYSEYGAWADREYMSHTDDWSRIIESSHCTQCALFAFIAIFCKIIGNHNNYLITLSVSMGTQFMNSILYLFAYFIQEKEPANINYNSSSFPTNTWLTDRPFMLVNIFWFVMPFYIISYYIIKNIITLKKNTKFYYLIKS